MTDTISTYVDTRSQLRFASATIDTEYGGPGDPIVIEFGPDGVVELHDTAGIAIGSMKWDDEEGWIHV